MWRLILFILICEAVGLASSVFTLPAISSWYLTLHKPFFNPPNWIFGPVWSTLYALMGISLYLVWQKGIKKKNVKDAVFIFTIQLVFNFFWSLLFFAWHLIFFALIEIVILWFLIVFTILKFTKLSKNAGLALWPYLVWVSFAVILNLSLFILNR